MMNPNALGLPAPASRRVEAGRGMVWLQQGWGFFLRNPGTWIAIALLLMVIYALFSLVPLLGQIAGQLMAPLFAAGLLLGCRSLDNGAGIRVEHLFLAFRQHSGNLLLVGFFYLLGVGGAFVAALLGGGGVALAGSFLSMGRDAMMALSLFSGALIFILIFVLLSVPLLMAFWFAPALVLFRDVAPLPAMMASFQACLRNILPFMVYGLFGMLLMVLAAIPLGLGFLVLIPVFIGSCYWSYVDIFE